MKKFWLRSVIFFALGVVGYFLFSAYIVLTERREYLKFIDTFVYTLDKDIVDCVDSRDGKHETPRKLLKKKGCFEDPEVLKNNRYIIITCYENERLSDMSIYGTTEDNCHDATPMANYILKKRKN